MGSVTWTVTDAGEIIVSRIVENRIVQTNLTEALRNVKPPHSQAGGPKDSGLRDALRALSDEMDEGDERYMQWHREQFDKAKQMRKNGRGLRGFM